MSLKKSNTKGNLMRGKPLVLSLYIEELMDWNSDRIWSILKLNLIGGDVPPIDLHKLIQKSNRKNTSDLVEFFVLKITIMIAELLLVFDQSVHRSEKKEPKWHWNDSTQ